MRSSLAILAMTILVSGCSSSAPAPDRDSEEPRDPGLSQAPWAAGTLPPAAAPPMLLDTWQTAENRSTCAPMSFTGQLDGTPRKANFSGGWAVAWDASSGPGRAPSGETCSDCGRGQYGIAGTGVEPTPDTYDDWPHREMFEDGSQVGYGPRDRQWLAYLEVAGQRCLYNVWSYRGREHLESLLERLRFVDTS